MLYKDLRTEYAKCKARSLRWEEEKLLLLEEMRRTLHFLKWKSEWWSSRCKHRTGEDPAHFSQSGHEAYAAQQSFQILRLAKMFAKLWEPLFKENSFDDAIVWLHNLTLDNIRRNG
jgi:hypothetical protein